MSEDYLQSLYDDADIQEEVAIADIGDGQRGVRSGEIGDT